MHLQANVPHVDKDEKRWVFFVASIVMLITTLPYFLGYHHQGEELRFTGFVFAVEDGNSYIAKMLSGYAGAWLFRTPYTPLPQQGVLVFLPYLILGKLAAPPGLHEQHVVLYHLFRLFSGFVLFWVTYRFISIFVEEVKWRRLGLMLAMVGSGLGWIILLCGKDTVFSSLPLDFYSPETFGFLSIYGIPHLAMARAFSLQVFIEYFRFLNILNLSSTQTRVILWRAGLSWLMAGVFQPLNMAIIGFVLMVHIIGMLFIERFLQDDESKEILLRFKRRASFLLCGSVAMMYFAYLFAASLQDPFLRAWAAQNRIRSPHPIHYLLAYGLIAPYAIAGSRKILKKSLEAGSFPVFWVSALPLLAYFPVNLQRRLPDGVWVSLVTLAMVGVSSFNDLLSPAQARKRRWYVAVLGFSFLSSLLLLLGGVNAVVERRDVLFRAADEVEVFTALASTGDTGGVVLGAYRTGNALPAWAPQRVVIGHGPESANLDELNLLVVEFYSTNSNLDRISFLEEYDVSYVFWGPAERALGDWQPENVPFLSLVASSGEYSVYRVLSHSAIP